MKEQNLIDLNQICSHHNIELPFVLSLHETALIDVVTIEKSRFIENKQLPQLEKYITFHYKLGINLEGIEAINHLLKKMEDLQKEVVSLKNQLEFHTHTS